MTTLLNGERVSKNDMLIHFTGAIDELNSHLGLVKALLGGGDTGKFVEEIQKNLMKLMSHASDSKNDKYIFTETEPAGLEKETERLKAMLPEISQFILPGRDAVEAQIHIARTVARRAERLFAAANEKQPLCPNVGVYLNKLSGYLFFLSQLPRN
jgi:ATP:cob(I)alamin adenosyltransferase